MTNHRVAQRRPTPWLLWVIGCLALLWNGLGTFLWSGTTFTPEVALAELPVEHKSYVQSLPWWSTVTWGVGVLSGLAGAILLLFRSRLSVPAFGLSLLGAITNQFVYLTNPAPSEFVSIPLVVFIVMFAFIQLWYANKVKRQGTL